MPAMPASPRQRSRDLPDKPGRARLPTAAAASKQAGRLVLHKPGDLPKNVLPEALQHAEAPRVRKLADQITDTADGAPKEMHARPEKPATTAAEELLVGAVRVRLPCAEALRTEFRAGHPGVRFRVERVTGERQA